MGIVSRPGELIWWCHDLITAWVCSIPRRNLLRAIPSILVISILGFSALVAYSKSGASWRFSQLDDRFMAAWKAEDYKTAELVLNRQLKAEPDDSDLLFRLGLVKQNLGQTEEAVRIISNLSLTPRHEASARWLLENVYKGMKWAKMASTKKAEVGRLIELIHKSSPRDAQISLFLVDYYLASDKASQALPILEQLAAREPLMYVRAAYLAQALNLDSRAKRLAEQGLISIGKLSKESPHDVKLAFALAECHVLLNQYPDALIVLNKLKIITGNSEERAVINSVIGDLYLFWISDWEKAGKKSEVEKLRLLGSALESAPNHPGLNALLIEKVINLDDGDVQMAKVREALVKGASPGIAHFIQGTVALMHDDHDGGIAHLRLASELLPNSSLILNNLAYGLSLREDSDLEQVLKIADSAVEHSVIPNPSVFETRGRILFKMGRYVEAISELEKAMVDPSLKKDCHLMLSKCYLEIGDKELSKLHQSVADTP